MNSFIINSTRRRESSYVMKNEYEFTPGHVTREIYIRFVPRSFRTEFVKKKKKKNN